MVTSWPHAEFGVNVEDTRKVVKNVSEKNLYLVLSNDLPKDAKLWLAKEKYFGRGFRTSLTLIYKTIKDVIPKDVAYIISASKKRRINLHLGVHVKVWERDEKLDRESYYERISKVNDLFYLVLIAYNLPDIPYLPLFFLQSHSYFIASIRLITACQFTESWPCIRGSIESAVYGYEIYKDPDQWKIYCVRVKGEQQKKDCKKIFSAPKIFNKYKKDLAALKILYDESIEKGAHPNIEGLKTKVQNVIIDNIPHTQLNFLQGNIEECKNTLILCRNIGLEILKLIFKVYEF